MKKLYLLLLSSYVLSATEPSPYTKKQPIVPSYFSQNSLDIFKRALKSFSRETVKNYFDPVASLMNTKEIIKAQYPHTHNQHNRFLLVLLARLFDEERSETLENCLHNIEGSLIKQSKLPHEAFLTEADISFMKEKYPHPMTTSYSAKFLLNFMMCGYLKDYVKIMPLHDGEWKPTLNDMAALFNDLHKETTGALRKKINMLRVRVRQFVKEYFSKPYQPCTYTTKVITKNKKTVSVFKFLNRYVQPKKSELQNYEDKYGEISFYCKRNFNKDEEVGSYSINYGQDGGGMFVIVSYPVKYGVFDGGVVVKCIEKQVTDFDEFMDI